MNGENEARNRLYRLALSKLSRTDVTPRALYAYLLEKKPEAEHELAKEVVRELAREGFVNESKSYQALMDEGERKHWGPLKLKAELNRRSFSPACLRRFERESIDWEERAAACVTERPDSPEELRRACARLMSRGFDRGTAMSVLCSCEAENE